MMKIRYFAGLLGIALLMFIASPGETLAQTQCPVGTAAGSATCAPDTPQGSYDTGPRRVRERVHGLAAFAYNVDTGQVYAWTMHGNGRISPRGRALEKCRRPNHDRDVHSAPPSEPDANCEFITEWQNACSAVAVGEVQRVRHFFSQPASNARAARTVAMSQCEASGSNCSIAHDAVCVARTTRYR